MLPNFQLNYQTSQQSKKVFPASQVEENVNSRSVYVQIFLGQEVGVFLEWTLSERSCLPQIRSQVPISLAQSRVHSFSEVSKGRGLS